MWYIAAGYSLPAGIEAYLLHYATELRRQGFATRILVFQPLPTVKHRYLLSLEERGIPIVSLYSSSAWRARSRMAALWLPWFLLALVRERRWPDSRAFAQWVRKRCAVALLGRLIRRECPDVIHVKGRVLAETWPVLPAERSVYQHALMGTVDPSWEPSEVASFRKFANRCARLFVQGRGIAETLAREYGIERPIDVVFTMAPDECGSVGASECPEVACSPSATSLPRAPITSIRPDSAPPPRRYPDTFIPPHSHTALARRFGIVCRFTEQKGIAYILEALKLYRERHGDVHFLFAGQGPLEDTIRDFAARHGLKHVRTERLERLADTLSGIDVFVHPGLDDAMPVSLVEALMFGKPCVSTRIGGVPDLIRDGVEGVLITPASAGQIVDAMERFSAMPPSEFQGFCRRARERYEAVCRPEIVGSIVADHYRSIIAGAADGRAGRGVRTE